MKQFLFSSLLLISILVAGCIGGSQGTKSPSLSASTQTQALSFQDPIVGTWQSEGITIIFFENGKASWNNQGGEWEKYDDTHYAFSAPDTMTTVFTYNPQSSTISTTLWNNYNVITLKRVS